MEHLKNAAKSAMGYVLGHEEEKDVRQAEALTPTQVKNNAGGFGWKVDDMNRLRRFLCLGSEGGTYYATEQKLGLENAKSISRLIDSGRGLDVVNEVVSFSVEGRTAKQNSVIFVLAMCARQTKDVKAKKLAYEKLADVCRIPTHLFMFVEYCEQLSGESSGWGRAHRKAISGWYLRFRDDPHKLAVHVTKYKNRGGWEHRDVLRLAHPKPDSDATAAVIRYVIKGLQPAEEGFLTEQSDGKLKKTFEFLQAVENVKKAQDEEAVAFLIRQNRLVREHIPTNFLKSLEVWRALLQRMPMTAMIRNLNKMTSIGLLQRDSIEVKLVLDKLTDPESLRAAKVHPFNVLVAWKTYQQGHGDRGKLAWIPVPAIVKALEQAYYVSFKFVEPTNKRYCLAIDVSGSMGCPILGSTINCNVAAAAMAMVTARTETNFEMVAFSTDLKPLKVTSSMELDKVITMIYQIPMGGTDCAQPMLWAKKYNKKFDVFVVYTDCETWAGRVHPAEALRKYRKHSGIWDAKLVVCAMSSGGFTLADPEDPGMLDMAGFDSSAPEVMSNFIQGRI